MFFCEMPGTLSHPYLSAEGKKTYVRGGCLRSHKSTLSYIDGYHYRFFLKTWQNIHSMKRS